MRRLYQHFTFCFYLPSKIAINAVRWKRKAGFKTKVPIITAYYVRDELRFTAAARGKAPSCGGRYQPWLLQCWRGKSGISRRYLADADAGGRGLTRGMVMLTPYYHRECWCYSIWPVGTKYLANKHTLIIWPSRRTGGSRPCRCKPDEK